MTEFEKILGDLICEIDGDYAVQINEGDYNRYIGYYSRALMDEAKNEMKREDEIARMERERKEYERLKLIYGDDELV